MTPPPNNGSVHFEYLTSLTPTPSDPALILAAVRKLAEAMGIELKETPDESL